MAVYGMAMGLAPIFGFMISGIIMGNDLGFPVVFYTGSAVLLAGAVAALLLPTQREQRERAGEDRAGVLDGIKALLRRPPVVACYASAFSLWFVFGGLSVLLPLHMEALGLTAFHFSMVLVAMTGAFVLLQYPLGRSSDRIGRKLPSFIGLLLLSAGIWLMPVLTDFRALLAAGALSGIGMGSVFPSVSAWLSDNTDESERGLATGVFHALITGSVAVGAPVMGVLGRWLGAGPALPLVTVVPLGAAVLVLLLGGRQSSDRMKAAYQK
jgi:MFS family permease